MNWIVLDLKRDIFLRGLWQNIFFNKIWKYLKKGKFLLELWNSSRFNLLSLFAFEF